MTDEEIRHRAVTAPRFGENYHRPNPRIRRLVRAVDKIKGDPPPAMIRRLAYTYLETVGVVQTIVAVRKEREASLTRAEHKRPDRWTETENRLLKSMWAERNGHTLDQMLNQMAEALSSLRSNKARGVRRTASAVNAQRQKIKLVLSMDETEERKKRKGVAEVEADCASK